MTTGQAREIYNRVKQDVTMVEIGVNFLLDIGETDSYWIYDTLVNSIQLTPKQASKAIHIYQELIN